MTDRAARGDDGRQPCAAPELAARQEGADGRLEFGDETYRGADGRQHGHARGVRTEPELISALRALPGVSQVSLSLHRPWSQGG